MRKSGALHVALYLKQCAGSLQLAYGGDKRPPELLAVFLLSKILLVAKKVDKSLFEPMTSPVCDADRADVMVNRLKATFFDRYHGIPLDRSYSPFPSLG
ncbi:hypothetical protein GBA52_015376 [Prunus armeniaca]|nr:hypothetical protein GBA52_015376 [Prunus armeniaca]